MTPWEALGIAALILAVAVLGVRGVRRTYDRDPRNLASGRPRPPWWRIRIRAWLAPCTLVPIIFATICAGLGMLCLSIFLWSDLDVFAFSCVGLMAASLGCFLWSIYDYADLPRKRREGRDEDDAT